MAERPEHDGYTERPRAKRKLSFWTLAAPIAAAVLFIVFFTALNGSCLKDGCDTKKEEKKEGPANALVAGARAKVKAGDSVGTLAQRFNLTEDELKACNPTVDPQTLQPGQYLVVSAASCENADRAEAGANPDPLAGETSAAPKAPKPKDNATAAADPSMSPSGEAKEGDEATNADAAAAAAAAKKAGTSTTPSTGADADGE